VEITHDIGRSFGLPLVASKEISVDFREKIGTLQRQLMNVRFDGSLSVASSPKSKASSSDVKLTAEIEEEIVNVCIDDVVL